METPAEALPAGHTTAGGRNTGTSVARTEFAMKKGGMAPVKEFGNSPSCTRRVKPPTQCGSVPDSALESSRSSVRVEESAASDGGSVPDKALLFSSRRERRDSDPSEGGSVPCSALKRSCSSPSRGMAPMDAGSVPVRF